MAAIVRIPKKVTKKAAKKSEIKPKAVKKTAPVKVKTFEEVIRTKTAQETIDLIGLWVSKHSVLVIDYTNWFIGLSDKENTTGGLNYPHSYYVESKDIALAIEKYFHDKGMKTEDFKGNVTAKTKYVYMHKRA